MQVPAVSACVIEPFRNNCEDKDSNTGCINNASLSMGKISGIELFETINEWKDFCQTQIMANNIDYIA